MLDRQNNKIYIQYRKKSVGGSVGAVLFTGAACMSIYHQIINTHYKWEVLNIFFKSAFTTALLIIIFVVIGIIGVMNSVFSSDIDFHLDLNTRELILVTGRKPFVTKVTLAFNRIREINIIRTNIQSGNGNDYKAVNHFMLDIYDEDLNAYRCYDSIHLEHILAIASELSAVCDTTLKDRTAIEDYEGFKKRIL